MVEPGFQLRGDKIKIVLKELSIFFLIIMYYLWTPLIELPLKKMG